MTDEYRIKATLSGSLAFEDYEEVEGRNVVENDQVTCYKENNQVNSDRSVHIVKNRIRKGRRHEIVTGRWEGSYCGCYLRDYANQHGQGGAHPDCTPDLDR
jgi:hypothetical protein